MNCLCHKNIYNDSKTGPEKFNVRVDYGSHTTRYANEMNMKVKNFKTEKGKHAIAHRGQTSWEKLPNEQKNCNRFSSFKRQLLGRLTGELGNHPA